MPLRGVKKIEKKSLAFGQFPASYGYETMVKKSKQNIINSLRNRVTKFLLISAYMKIRMIEVKTKILDLMGGITLRYGEIVPKRTKMGIKYEKMHSNI